MTLKRFCAIPDIRRARDLSAEAILKDAAGRIRRLLDTIRTRQRDRRQTSYGLIGEDLRLRQRFFAPVLEMSESGLDALRRDAQASMDHRFDLLGSGPVWVHHGMACAGIGGRRFPPGPTVKADPAGRWLAGRITPANLERSRQVWRRIKGPYRPIDWHIDFRSGYRWPETAWYRQIRYGHLPGIDVKSPWELARAQHLPRLALAGRFGAQKIHGFPPFHRCFLEFQNQVLDFIAANPPRFGVNWRSPMDVAIRTANWLLAYDLFRGAGAPAPRGFEAIFCSSILDHARHIVRNLEWSAFFAGNHYLANLAGLLFAGAYLPRTEETAGWLEFSVREMDAQIRRQFHPDGSFFEASTAYHLLAFDIVLWTTALLHHILRHDSPRLESIRRFFRPEMQAVLEKTADFIVAATQPDGRLPQIGDNDNGRLVCLEPPPADSLCGKGLVAAAGVLLGRSDLIEFGNEQTTAAEVVRSPAQQTRAEPSRLLFSSRFLGKAKGSEKMPPAAGRTPGRKKDNGPFVRMDAFPDFGIYFYRWAAFYLAVRCGRYGEGYMGAHAHNDQLSFVLCCGGLPILVDPGTYLYTPLPRLRNAFRATAAHNTVAIGGGEQNRLSQKSSDLFRLPDRTRSRVVRADRELFIGEHVGFKDPLRRSLRFHPKGLYGTDRYPGGRIKRLYFHFAPGLSVRPLEDGSGVEAAAAGRIVIRGGPGTWSCRPAGHSPSYGTVQSSVCTVLASRAPEITWHILTTAGGKT